MTKITHDEMLPETRAMFAEGSATLCRLSNVAFGSPGWHVMALVRRGLWVEIERRVSDDPIMGYSAYGAPRAALATAPQT